MKKPEELTEELKKACGETLYGVILYGSGVAGDRIEKKSDWNVLVVLKTLGIRELQALAPLSAKWVKAGNPAPLLFTEDRLKTSGDVFPIELWDIQSTHKILFGEDPLKNVEINKEHLRWELEHELKGKLIQLREGFLAVGGKAGALKNILMRSHSTFLVLFRAALRLHNENPPARKMEALPLLKKRINFDTTPFETIASMRMGTLSRSVDVIELFEQYLKAIEIIVDAVDGWINKG